MNQLVLIPAYGRDYKTRAAVLADLRAGKDFILVRFGQRDLPINLDQIWRVGPDTLLVRYAGLARVAIFTVDSEGGVS